MNTNSVYNRSSYINEENKSLEKYLRIVGNKVISMCERFWYGKKSNNTLHKMNSLKNKIPDYKQTIERIVKDKIKENIEMVGNWNELGCICGNNSDIIFLRKLLLEYLSDTQKYESVIEEQFKRNKLDRTLALCNRVYHSIGLFPQRTKSSYKNTSCRSSCSSKSSNSSKNSRSKRRAQPRDNHLNKTILWDTVINSIHDMEAYETIFIVLAWEFTLRRICATLIQNKADSGHERIIEILLCLLSPIAV